MTKRKDETEEEREKRLAYHREYARRRTAGEPEYAHRLRKACARFRAKPENREKARAYAFKQKHGVTRIEADAMIEAQSGLCVICQEPPKENARLHVDHDHETGKVRGMLCGNCNRALGMVKENVETLLRMASYLS